MKAPADGRSWWGRSPIAWRPMSVEVDEVSLHETVTRVLSEHFGRTVSLTGFARDKSPFATLFPADILRLEVDGATELRVFLKHLGDEQKDHPDKLGPAREVGIYRELFRDERLPIPGYFGAVEHPASGRTDLFLEYVDDWNLKYHGLVDWYRAAHELGRMHAWFAARRSSIEGWPLLQRLGAEYAWSWARRAAEEAARRNPRLGRRLGSLLDRYDPVAQVLEEAPTTLVHNDLSPKNVLADRSRTPTRICFIDWESAGVGGGVFDLVNLSYGLEPQARFEMRRSYLRGLDHGGGNVPEPHELSRLEAASEAHKALWRAAHCGVWELPDASVLAFCAEAESAVDALGEGTGGGARR